MPGDTQPAGPAHDVAERLQKYLSRSGVASRRAAEEMILAGRVTVNGITATTLDDPQGRPTVARYIEPRRGRLFPVGRLDRDTTGLLLLTDDGDLAHALMHPRHHVPKVYRATVDGVPDAADLEALRSGLDLDDGRTAPADARVLSRDGSRSSLVELTLREGRKRQVRRMLSAVGHPVRALDRVAYGPLELDGLPRGVTRELTGDEVEALRRATRGEA